MKYALIAGALALAIPLAACDPSALTFTPQEQALIQGDLDAVCPVIASLDATVRASFNGNVAVALDNVELACPPNPPPTNIIVIASDVVTVLVSLRPYLPRIAAASRAAVTTAVSHAQGIAAAHSMALPAAVK